MNQEQVVVAACAVLHLPVKVGLGTIPMRIQNQ